MCADFLTFSDFPEGRVCVFGNPPFGTRNSLSKQFIRRALLYSDIIAFVLPEAFEKFTYQRIFPDDWSLVDILQLPENSFLLEGKDYHVPCVFQIWVKGRWNIDLRKPNEMRTSTFDFRIVSKQEQGGLFVFGASPAKYIDPADVNSNNRGYYIEATGASLSDIKFVLDHGDWRKYGKSSVNGGVFWLTKTEFINSYESIKNDLYNAGHSHEHEDG